MADRMRHGGDRARRLPQLHLVDGDRHVHHLFRGVGVPLGERLAVQQHRAVQLSSGRDRRYTPARSSMMARTAAASLGASMT